MDVGTAATNAGAPPVAQRLPRPAGATAPPTVGDATVHAVSAAIVPESETP